MDGVLSWCSGGLSPRVRGSLLSFIVTLAERGSIPAGAGEPLLIRPARRLMRVYPRGCGGADSFMRVDALRMGLSPRVRGSRFRTRHSCRL